MAGAPIGNTNAKKGRMWNEALRQAIENDNGERLRASIEQLLNLASIGEPWAIKELADRLDGRPKQVNYLEVENAELRAIKVTFVRPNGIEVENLSISNKSS
jgi:hypothetical protein